MRSYRVKPYTVLRVSLALLSAGFPLLALVTAGTETLTAIRTHRSDLYYVDHNYLGDAIWWGLIGLSGLVPAGWVMLNRAVRLRWLWLPTVVSVFMILYPNAIAYGRVVPPFPHAIAGHHVYYELSSLYSEVKDAADRRQPNSCVSGRTHTLSPYSRAGTRLFYQRECVTTDQPLDSLLVSSAPGTLFFLTRPGDSSIRLVATVLPSNMSPTATWLRDRWGKLVQFTVSPVELP